MADEFYFFDTIKVFSYHKLTADIAPTSLDVVLDLYPGKPNYSLAKHYKLPVELLSKEFTDLLSAAGLEAHHAEIFYRPGNGPDMDAYIHTDGHRIYPGFAKINYVTGGKNNIMKWWRPLKPITDDNIQTTPVGTKYLYFDAKDCKLYNQVDMQGLYVVNAAIPHSVEMSTGSVSTPRICISVTPKLKNSGWITMGCIDAKYRLEHAVKNQRL
jgi:hypothetical protein